MAAMIMPNRPMDQAKLLKRLRDSHPQVRFTAGKDFVWSPETQEVFYISNPKLRAQDAWSLLHETGHALLGHTSYKADIELIRLEMDAWDKAKELAAEFDIRIDEDHIQNCLDTYRDWLYARSICPGCTTKCLQSSNYTHYRCHNCHTTWKVTPSRFARPYRATKGIKAPRSIFHALEAT
jgi:hypothetical protein